MREQEFSLKKMMHSMRSSRSTCKGKNTSSHIMGRKTSNFELMEIQLIKAKREAKKAKALLDETYGEYSDQLEEQVPRRRPRTIGLKRSLDLEKQKEAELANELTLNQQFAKMINENHEHWI